MRTKIQVHKSIGVFAYDVTMYVVISPEKSMMMSSNFPHHLLNRSQIIDQWHTYYSNDFCSLWTGAIREPGVLNPINCHFQCGTSQVEGQSSWSLYTGWKPPTPGIPPPASGWVHCINTVRLVCKHMPCFWWIYICNCEQFCMFVKLYG